MLKAGLGVLKADAESEREAYKQGYSEAEVRFKVIYRCSVCGKPIAIESQQAMQSATKYMTEHRWAHSECHEKGTGK